MADFVSIISVVLAIASAATGCTWVLFRAIAEAREEGREGRKSLYEAIEALSKTVDRTYVRRDVYEAEKRASDKIRTETEKRDTELIQLLKIIADCLRQKGRTHHNEIST